MSKYLNLAYKNLCRRRIRTFLTIGGVGIAVAVLVSLLGFNAGYRRALEKDVSGMGYQIMITAKGCPYELATVALSGSGALRYLTDDTVAKIRQDDEVADLTPTLLHTLPRQEGVGFYTFWGIDLENYKKLHPMIKIVNGRWFEPRKVNPDEVYLKNGRVVRGLIVGEGEFEKITGKELDPVSGEYAEVKKRIKTIKIMIPSRIYNKTDVVSVSGETKDEILLKDGNKVTGVIIDETPTAYIVGDIELAYPTTEEIDQDLIERNADGSLKIIDYDKPEDNIETEVVLGWEAAQTGFVKVGQKVTLPVNEMVMVKMKEKITDPETGQQKEVEREMEKPIASIYTFKVVGILDRVGSKDDGSYFIQLEEAQRIFRKYKMLTDIGVKLKDLARLPMFTDRIYNRKELGETQIISLAEVKGTILNLVQTAKILVMSVAFIAIFVALIGVMNTILMSVFERTKEIGIMKAIGASRMDIFKLIWLETIIICALGGIVGTLMAVIGGNFIEKLIRAVMSRAGYVPAGQIVHFTPQIIIGCFAGAIILGVLSGIWPAYRASSMRPVEAIRLGD
ncbi:MAG: ABC transporter permease [Candidatus Omnitrophota bacterium]|nr:ABC transporter permease [Candidatus Omnitrophota bacterium]